MSRLALSVGVAALVALAGCGDPDPSPAPTGPVASATDPSVTEPSVTDPSVTPMPVAACTGSAMDQVVRAALDPAGEIPGSIEIAECNNPYARVFYRPDAPNLETEQVFLFDDFGEWVVLTYGTGIDCATDPDLGAELEQACRMLGLRDSS